MTRDDYLLRPNACLECRSPILLLPGQKLSEIRVKKFCDRSCAARYNNRRSPKRTLEGHCNSCGNPIPASRHYCSHACRMAPARLEGRTAEQVRMAAVQSVVTWRQRLKVRAVEYMGGSCQLCGYARCLQALQFHHLDPRQKDFTISGKTKAWERIREELDKCLLLCANCHGEVHAGIVSPCIPR